MPSSAPYDASAIEYYTIPSFTFASGTTLHDVKVAYKSINPSSTKGAVLIPTCYGGLINSTLTFTEDRSSSSSASASCLADYHVVVAAMLGNGESASPSNKPLFPSPGELHYEDVIRAHHALLTSHLKISHLEAVLGFSMGAQQAYYWAVMYPSFLTRAIAICGSARTSPHNYAFLEGPVAALTNAIDYVAWREVKEKKSKGEGVFGGDWEKLRPERGLRAFGRAYNAWLTSAGWFRERWWSVRGPAREPGGGEKGEGERGNADAGLGFASVEEYIVNFSEEGFLAWDAEDLLVLGRMWQMGDVSRVIPGREMAVATLGGGVGDDDMFAAALQSIQAKVLVMPCRTDQYFPPEDSEVEMRYLKHGTYAPIESIWGHVAGGGLNQSDVEWMDGRIGEFMAS